MAVQILLSPPLYHTDMIKLTCEDCGKTDETVEKTNCPFAEDVWNEIVEMNLCPDCYHERVMDI